jgi:hypothetical protein
VSDTELRSLILILYLWLCTINHSEQNYFGDMLEEIIRKNEIDSKLIIVIKVWKIIDIKFPTEEEKEAKKQGAAS